MDQSPGEALLPLAIAGGEPWSKVMPHGLDEDAPLGPVLARACWAPHYGPDPISRPVGNPSLRLSLLSIIFSSRTKQLATVARMLDLLSVALELGLALSISHPVP